MKTKSTEIQSAERVLNLLEKANSHAEDILDSLPSAFFVINEKDEVLRGNHQFCRLMNVDAENILRVKIDRLFRRSKWKIFQQYLNKLRNDSTVDIGLNFELGIADAEDCAVDKSFFWRMSKIKVSNKAEGCIISVIGEDISGLRETEKKLSEIFHSIPQGILTVDNQGTIENFYSDYLEHLLSSTDFCGKKIMDVLFYPAMKHMPLKDQAGLKKTLMAIENQEQIFGASVNKLPTDIFYQDPGDHRSGRWLKIIYQPIFHETITKRTLLILEDYTKIVEANKKAENAEQIEKQSIAMYESAIRDPLTGLYSRLFMKDSVNKMMAAHNRQTFEHSCCLIIFDIDHFKRVNDTYGHLEGDVVLRQIAKIILNCSRQNDLPIRYGGEELMIFLQSDIGNSIQIAERIRSEVEKMVFNLGGEQVRVTISGGVVAHRIGESLDEIIKRCDRLLYSAKNNGRNQIIAEDVD